MKKIILLLTILFTQIIVAQDVQETKPVFEETKRLAEQGDANAQHILGLCYDNGEGTTKDPKKAVFWYTKAAEQGDAKAQTNLSVLYTFGEGTQKDLKKAAYWCKKAQENGAEVAKKLWKDYELWKYE